MHVKYRQAYEHNYYANKYQPAQTFNKQKIGRKKRARNFVEDGKLYKIDYKTQYIFAAACTTANRKD